MPKVAVTNEEKQLSYYKYFERDLAPVPQELLQIAEGDPADPSDLLPFEMRNLFITGEDSSFCRNGFGNFGDGTAYLATELYMPGVTSEMLDWWFPWHSVGSDLRYKIWDPEDHYFATAHPASRVLDPNIPMAQKTWNTEHFIMENAGMGPQFVQILFLRPGDLGLDESQTGTDNCSSLVCGIGKNTGTTMIHKWRPYKEGVQFCSRFWIGCGMREDKTFGRCLPPGAEIPPFIPRRMYAHDIKEYTHLASFLPELYAEEKENF